MANDVLTKGDHRYLNGKPITVTQVWEGAITYVEGHHTLLHASLIDFLPNRFKSKH